MSTRPPFALTKWYVDCVAPDGRAVIGYWASLAWRGVALTWQSVTLHEPGRPPVTRSCLSSGAPPQAAGGTITWNAPALGCVARIESRQRPIAERLLERETGVVEWRVEAPAAAVSFDLEGVAPVRGGGYAERIVISVPPWRLPIRELRWGRWIDAAGARSVVWIDWRGESPRTWVFADGVIVPAAIVTDEGIEADGMSLALGDRRTLEARRFAELAATIPPLRALVPKSMLALRETKWCSAGTLHDATAAASAGYAIHELAVFG
jgi:hypothetical protein